MESCTHKWVSSSASNVYFLVNVKVAFRVSVYAKMYCLVHDWDLFSIQSYGRDILSIIGHNYSFYILEEVNNYADADFKRLKDIGGGHTIYRRSHYLPKRTEKALKWREIGKIKQKVYRPQK